MPPNKLGEYLSVGHSSAVPNAADKMPPSNPLSSASASPSTAPTPTPAKATTTQTIKPPPPRDPSLSAIENTLELTALTDLGPNVFTNTRPLWRPPNARGIFGGAVIAQSLAAAIKTVSDGFSIHSMHCYFVLAGDWLTPVVYYVENVREGRSFATRTVQARQKGRCIFTTTCSFQKVVGGGNGTEAIEHQEELPADIPTPEECDDGEKEAARLVGSGEMSVQQVERWRRSKLNDPFERRVIGTLNADGPNPTAKRIRSWVRARGHISSPTGSAPHLEALAYVSDSWFLGTILRTTRTKSVGMMVSLDHTIYFHAPFRADDWMFLESDTPWAGAERGLVHQRIMDRHGGLIATCFQEGVLRVSELKGEDKVVGTAAGEKKGSKL